VFRVVLSLYYHESAWKSMGGGRTSKSAADATRFKVAITQVVESHVMGSSHARFGSGGRGRETLNQRNLGDMAPSQQYLKSPLRRSASR
jgi:hypothetical protein